MDLVQVDNLGAEAAQAGVDRLPDVVGMRAVALVVDAMPELGGDQHIMPARAERPSEVLLAFRAAVDVRRIEEIDAGVKRRMHDGVRGRFVDAPAEIIASDADDRYR